jgi:hypothetical protein
MFNKNPFSCIKSINKELESSDQLSATSIKNKLKKIISSLLGRKRNEKMCLEKSTIKANFNENLKDSELNLTEKNLLTSTKIFNSSNYYSIDFLHEGVYSDFSDGSFMSLETTILNSSLLSISSMESIDFSRFYSPFNDKPLIHSKFCPLISSSRTSLIINQKIETDFSLSRKLKPFKTSRIKNLINESKKAKLTLDEPIASFNKITLNNSFKYYLINDSNFYSSINSDNSENKYSSTLLSIKTFKRRSKLKYLNFSEFINNKIYGIYF